jgi:hypothetical protein
MTDVAVPHFLPGQPAPRSSAYHEVDPWTWKVVRRLLVARGEQFPSVKREGGFYTSSKTPLEPRSAAQSA